LLSNANFWPQDPVTNLVTLAPNSEAKHLILCDTALSSLLGHPDGGHVEAGFFISVALGGARVSKTAQN
jgi:hypothetical protein